MAPFWFCIKQTKSQILKHMCTETIGSPMISTKKE